MRLIKPILISTLVSIVCYFTAPIVAFFLLIVGVAALPFANLIMMTSIIAFVIMPGLIINISMTKKYNPIERVITLITYLILAVLIVLIGFFFINYFQNSFSSFGQF